MKMISVILLLRFPAIATRWQTGSATGQAAATGNQRKGSAGKRKKYSFFEAVKDDIISIAAFPLSLLQSYHFLIKR